MINPPDPSEAPGPSRRRNLRLALGFAAVYALLLTNTLLPAMGERPPVVAAIHTLPPHLLDTPLVEASRYCAAGVLSDHGLTLYVDTAGEVPGSGTLTMADALCILRALHAPAAVLEEIGSAQDGPGVHNASWMASGLVVPASFDLDGSLAAAWTYEPGTGLDLVVVQHFRMPDVTIYQLPAFQGRNGAGR